MRAARVMIAAAAAFALTARADDAPAATASPAQAHVAVNWSELEWGPAPAAFPKGAQVVVVQGDPAAEGKPFTVRMRMPKGYTIAPHFHPTAENVTVLSGKLLVGEGDKVDRKHAKALTMGGFASIPEGHHHYAIAAGPRTIVQVHAIGPLQITYVNPDDDPRKNVAAQEQAPGQKRSARTPTGR